MLFVQLLVLLTILACLYVNFRLGLALYISYFFLVPFMSVNYGGIKLTLLVIDVILLGAYWVKYGMQFDISIFKPIIVLYFLWFSETIFQNDMSFSVQYRYFYEELMQIFILPMVIFNSIKYDSKVLRYCIVSVIASSVIIIVYNFVLYWISDINPYVMAMSIEHAMNDGLDMSQFDFHREGITKRLSSVFPHPMNFGIYLGLLMVFVIHMAKDNKKYLYFTFIIIISIFISGVRTTIAAFLIVVLFYLLLVRKFSYFSFALVGVLGLYILASYWFPSLISTLNSFGADIEESGGSSIGMRIEQFNGCIAEISNNPLFGKGYGWSRAYIANFGGHSIIRGFESVLFRVLCDYGWIGLSFFIGCFYWMFHQIHIAFIDNQINRYILYCLWVFYLSYAFITGDYGYMKYTMLFFSILYCSLMYRDSDSKTAQITSI